MDTKEQKEYVKKLDTAEAIKIFNEVIRLSNLNLRRLSPSEIDFYNKVIKLLEDGKKFKQMWEELEEITGATEWEMVDLKEIKQRWLNENYRD